MKTIRETLKTPVTHSCDVLVAGGGVAGIAAALAAARQGKKVILLERGFMLGGLATAGIVTIYLPLCDGYGNQVSFGLAEELLRLSVSVPAEYCGIRDAWAKEGPRTEKDARFEADFNPQLFAILAEKALLKENVNILYGTVATATAVENDRIAAVMAENKSGRFGIAVTSVVDATGDADIVKFAGAPTETFKQGNILAAWYYGAGKNGYQRHMLGCSDIPEEEKNGREVEKLTNRRFTGLDGDEISEMTVLSHAQVLVDIQKRRADDASLQPATIPTVPQIRMTRRIDGVYTLSNKEMHTYFEDSIGMVSDWKKRGPVYEVPFRTLYCEKVKNLLTAGRCTSVTDPMWDIMRVIPCCAVTGEAAGIAAAMSDDMTTLDIAALQQKLRDVGVVIHEKDLEG